MNATAIRSKTQAWAHQQEAYDFLAERQYGYMSMGMGTGKSKVIVDVACNRDHRRILIVCPTSVVGVWPREFERHGASPVSVLALRKGSVKEKAALVERAFQRDQPTAVVVNYEAAWREPFASFAKSHRWDMVVLDEAHRIKKPTGKASKFCDKLRPKASQRACLSGTPFSHSPLDAFAQYRFLNPEILGRWYTHFRARYAVTNPLFPSMVTKWINQEELAEKLAPHTFQVGSDVLTLPSANHETLFVQLCPKARKAYKELEQELITEVEAGTVTVPNALVKLLRLQQITSGVLPASNGVERIDTGKREALADLLEDIGPHESVVVFCRFRHDLNTVAEVSQLLGRTYGELSGERHDLTEHAEMPEGIQVMGTQLQSGGVGIDLTRARYAIYLSMGFSLSDYEQSLARLHRPGQERPVFYYHLTAEDTVDQAVYAALGKRKEVVEYVLSSMKPFHSELAAF